MRVTFIIISLLYIYLFISLWGRNQLAYWLIEHSNVMAFIQKYFFLLSNLSWNPHNPLSNTYKTTYLSTLCTFVHWNGLQYLRCWSFLLHWRSAYWAQPLPPHQRFLCLHGFTLPSSALTMSSPREGPVLSPSLFFSLSIPSIFSTLSHLLSHFLYPCLAYSDPP